MLEAGFQPDFPPEVAREVRALNQGAPHSGPAARDLRSLLWSSIDNDSSRDLDQVDMLTNFRMAPAPAGGDCRCGCLCSQRFGHGPARCGGNHFGLCRSGDVPDVAGRTFHGPTSLLDAQDRLAIVIELHILDSGEVKAHDVYPAWLRNRAQLAYISTGAWLEGHGPIPPAVATCPAWRHNSACNRTLRKSCVAFANSTGRSPSARLKPRRCWKMAK